MFDPILISIDDAKRQIAGYTPDRAEEFQHESARLANKNFKKSLRENDSNKVILMCGGSASGKTEFLSEYLNDFEGIIFDSTLPTITGAEIKIKEIKKAKKEPVICAVLPDDLKRAFIAFLGRDRKFSDEYFYKTHSGARGTLLQLAKTHPEVEIRVYESSYKGETLVFKEIVFHNSLELIEFLEKSQYTESDILNLVKII